MNKIFHSRITWYNYLYLIVLAVTVFALLWEKHSIAAVIIMIFLVVLIERIIHTDYTVTTNGKLIIYHGRFSKRQEFLISKIVRIDEVRTFKIGRFYLTRYLLIKYEGGFMALTPVKEDELATSLLKINPKIAY